MNTNQNQYLVVEVKKPSLEKDQVGRKPGKEGKSLPNSVTEDVGAFSLSPTYSSKQLRSIKRLQVQQTMYLDGKKSKINHRGRSRW